MEQHLHSCARMLAIYVQRLMGIPDVEIWGCLNDSSSRLLMLALVKMGLLCLLIACSLYSLSTRRFPEAGQMLACIHPRYLRGKAMARMRKMKAFWPDD